MVREFQMIMFSRTQSDLFFWLLFTFFKIQQAFSIIKGPTDIEGYIGEDAHFMWNATNRQELLSVSWGIRKGNIADPLFINVNGYTGKVKFNIDLDDTIKRRVAFHGDLKKGLVWFVMRNLTVNDTNEYIASISDKVNGVQPYRVRLVVKQKSKVKPTTGLSVSTDKTAVSPSMTSNPQFTRKPQSVYHVSIGSTARLVWDHYIKNRTAQLLAYTMRWSLYDRSGGTVVVGGFNGSKFVTSKDCPTRLRGRVSKESTATLVIYNVTTADSGIYSFHLRWRSIDESNVKSLARLIVTNKPEIDVVELNNTVSSYEGGTIRLYCLARGVPSPLFTWYDPRNQSIAAGSRNVTGGSILIINPDSYGLYRCRAENILGYDEHFINVTQTGPEPSSTNRARKTNDHLMLRIIVLVMWHFLIQSAFDS